MFSQRTDGRDDMTFPVIAGAGCRNPGHPLQNFLCVHPHLSPWVDADPKKHGHMDASMHAHACSSSATLGLEILGVGQERVFLWGEECVYIQAEAAAAKRRIVLLSTSVTFELCSRTEVAEVCRVAGPLFNSIKMLAEHNYILEINTCVQNSVIRFSNVKGC